LPEARAPGRRVLVVSSSPRRDGNSYRLAAAARDGALEAGHDADLVVLDDHVASFLRDCRQCRRSDGSCAIDDGFAELFFERFLPAAGVILATPLYWYGVSAQLKAFFDRTFCFIAASYPGGAEVVARMQGKTLALLVSSEETYPGAPLGVIHEFQEYARYTNSTLVGTVRGIGNRRGDVHADPAAPLDAARALGADLFAATYTDYRIDTERPATTWPAR
jgi:multimeric flavodoxin WrbA